jgi:hypothetical protein
MQWTQNKTYIQGILNFFFNLLRFPIHTSTEKYIKSKLNHQNMGCAFKGNESTQKNLLEY